MRPSPHDRTVVSLALACAAAVTGCPSERDGAPPPPRDVVLATTTSTQDSGLLDVLVPAFGEECGIHVKVIAVGSGQALAMGRRGDADVILSHAPAAERAFMEEGCGAERALVMHNDFLIVGPPGDPAGVRAGPSARDAVLALDAVARARSPFASRGDDSGTHQLETALWCEAGIDPHGGDPWLIETGQGMGATLIVADQRRAYTLVDRGTWLARREALDLVPACEGDLRLRNVYHVILPNAARLAGVNVEGGRAFARFLVEPRAQGMIRTFGVEPFGEPLFHAGAEPGGGDLAE